MAAQTLTAHEDTVLTNYARFLRSCDASTSTVKHRTTFVRARVRDWTLDGFTEDNVRDYLADTKDRIAEKHGDKRRVWTLGTYHSHLRDFCAWAVLAGVIADDPMPRIPRPANPKGAPRPLRLDEIDRVLEVATGRTRDMVLLALLLGLRVSEIARIRGEDFGDDCLSVAGKGGDVVDLPLHPQVIAMRDRYPERGYWFPGSDAGHVRSNYVSRDVGELFRRVGIMSGSAHRLRHSFATYLLRDGVNVRTVQRLMRHANLETTAAYTAVDVDELAAAVGRLGFGGPTAA